MPEFSGQMKKMKAQKAFRPSSFLCDCCFAFEPVILASPQSQHASALLDVQGNFHTRTRRRAPAHQRALVSSQFSHGRIEGLQVHSIYLDFRQLQETSLVEALCLQCGEGSFCFFVMSGNLSDHLKLHGNNLL